VNTVCKVSRVIGRRPATTGGLITPPGAAADRLIGAFSASGITFVKLVGVGMILALLPVQ